MFGRLGAAASAGIPRGRTVVVLVLLGENVILLGGGGAHLMAEGLPPQPILEDRAARNIAT
jgi:hypothetical protein